MIRNYLKESFHWLHLAFFKPITMMKGLDRRRGKEALIIYAKVFPIGFAVILAIEAAIGGVTRFLGYSFNWFEAFLDTLVGGLVFGLLVGLFVGLVAGWAEVVPFGLGYSITFLSTYFRPFYLPPYIIQYWRGKRTSNPIKLFQNSPVYWDEVIAMPLPYLTDWLVRLVNHSREAGLAEIHFVAGKRPFQRRAAQKALISACRETPFSVISTNGRNPESL